MTPTFLVPCSVAESAFQQDIKALGVGNFYRRPVEHQLSRLVDAWQLSQPLSLRHLAIVRDTAISKTVAHYVHYSYESFQKLVDSGQSSWDAVEIVRKDLKAKKKKIAAAPIGTEPELDGYGFARLQPNCFHGRGSNATILESVLAAKLEPLYVGRQDPIAVKLEDGTYGDYWLSIYRSHISDTKTGIKFRPDLDYKHPKLRFLLSSPRRSHRDGEQSSGNPPRPIGRPRKYPTGEEPSASGNLQTRKRWKSSVAAARRYKAMKDKKSGPKLGIEGVGTPIRPSVNGAMLDSGVTKETQLERGADLQDIQRPPKRSATDAEFTDETRKEPPLAASEVNTSDTPPKKRLRGVEKQPMSATRIEREVSNPEIIRMGILGDDSALPSHASVASSPKELQARSEKRPLKKTKKAVESGPQKSNSRDDLAVLASAGNTLTYEEQAQLLGPRTTTGVYIGQRVLRKGGRGRPPKSRLLIARSSRLKDCAWFIEESPSATVTTMEQVSIAISSVQSSAADLSADIPSVTGISTVSAPLLTNADGPSILNTTTTSARFPDVFTAYTPTTGQKRKRTPSKSGSANLGLIGKDVIRRTVAPGESFSEPPEKKRREPTPIFEETQLSSGLVQGPRSQHATGDTDAHFHALSEDDDNDAIQLLNDVMHADGVGPLLIHTNGVAAQLNLRVPRKGDTATITSSNTDHQNEVMLDADFEELDAVSELPEVVAQYGPPEKTRKEFSQSEITTESARSNLIEDEPRGERSLDMTSSAASHVGDTCIPEVSNTVEGQSLGAAQLLVMSAQPTVTKISTSHDATQDMIGQVDEEDISRQEDTQEVTLIFDRGTTSSAGKHVTVPPSLTVGESVGKLGRKKARTPYPSRSMIALGGGSVGAQRRKIIMDIIESCGGLFPGERELWYPFASAWMKLPDAGKPDQRTVKMATKALVDGGKLRQLKFSFKDKKGVMLTKTIFTTPQISPASPAVKNLERKIIEEDPNPYIPPEADVSPEIRKSNQHSLSKLVPSKQMFFEKDDKVQLQYIPAYVKHAQMSRKLALERRRIREEALMGNTRTEDNSWRGGDSLPESLPRRRVEPLAKGIKPGRIQRLARLQRPFGFRPRVSPPPPPTFAVAIPRGVEAGPAYDLELPIDDPIFSIRQAPRPMSLDPALQRNHRVEYETLGLSRSIHTLQGYPTRHEEPAVGRVGSILSDSRSGIAFTGTPQARPYQYWSRKSRDYTYNVHKVTLLNPTVVFHPPTGTFSTEYLILRKSRKRTRVEPASYRVREVTLPHQLEDITLHPDRSPEPDHATTDDPAKSKFDWDVDTVQEWELQNEYALPESSKNLHFINHSLKKDHESIQYEVGKDVFEAQEWEPGMTAKELRANYFRHAKDSQIGLDTLENNTPETVAPKTAKQSSLVPKLKTRRLTSLLERNTGGSKVMSDVDSATPDALRTMEPRKLRAPQTSRYMPMATVHRIMTAVVVIRTITGGLERNIDWVLVAQLFEDRFEPSFVQARWPTILQKNRLHVERLQADFQDVFIEAYEKGVVPPIDYDNLQDYDWAWLVDWAGKQLEMPGTRALPNLPGTRKQFDDLYDLRSEKDPEIDTLFEFNSGATLLKRTNIATTAPFTFPLQSQQRQTNAHKERLSIAKSWVRANVITPEEIYNPEEARRKLLSVGEDTIETALKELIAEKIVQQENRGRLVPGRNYDISASFLNNLKKNLEATHFHQAAAYKNSLDRSFAEHGSATYSYHASDGDVLTLTNLLAHNRITIHARDPPRKKFGLTDGGYKTRFMDKSRLNFAVDIRPSATYVYGNPLLPLPPPPQQHLAQPRPTLEGRIPAWFDIHGNFVPVMWEMALAACLASLVVRPGMGAGLMAGTFKGSLGAWEVERVLEWVVSAGAATKVGTEGYVLSEWWWTCLWAG